MTKIMAYKCPNCGWEVYARNKHDIHTCFCGTVRCDGYVITPEKIVGKQLEFRLVEIDASLQDISQDFYWNGGRFGSIQPTKKGK